MAARSDQGTDEAQRPAYPDEPDSGSGSDPDAGSGSDYRSGQLATCGKPSSSRRSQS